MSDTYLPPPPTPPAVNYAIAGQRIIARFADTVLLALAAALVASAVLLDGAGFDRYTDFDLGFIIIGLLLGAAYEIGFVAWKGATPGKMLVGLRVVDADTGTYPPGIDTATRRWLPSLLGSVPFVGGVLSLVVFVVSLVWLFSDPKHQTIYDRFARTYVIKT